MFEPIFPGMDPFIEDQRPWAEFHNGFIHRIHNLLSRFLVPLYTVVAEQYIHIGERPDVSVYRGRPGTEPLERTDLAITAATRLITPTISVEDEPLHLEIYDEHGQLITIIEVLSPTNKMRHFADYRIKRNKVLAASVHLVEIDLLRTGQRMEPVAPYDGYMMLVARAQTDQKPHRGELYEIGLREVLPVIPVPLKPGDPDVPLDLQGLFRQLYVDARYRLQLDYQKMPALPFSQDDLRWVQAQLNLP